MNYIGYFRSYPSDDLFSVKIMTDDGSDFTEIYLAGDSPFVVQYNTSKTPFDPIRTSTAQINVVWDTYLEDIITPYAQSVKVILTNKTKNITEWVGFVVPKIFDAGYEERYETYEIECADCISSLQYVKYTEMNGGGITTIKDMLKQIVDNCKLLDGFAWSLTKQVEGSTLYPDKVKLSEYNWHYNDVEEYLDLQQVLSDICQYFGFTAVQWKETLYLIDYQTFHINNDVYVSYHYKPSYGNGSPTHLNIPFTITKDSVKKNGATISFEPIYNKVSVKANMFNTDEVVPNIFDDANLVNRQAEYDGEGNITNPNFYFSQEITPVGTRASYRDGAGKPTEEAYDDNKNIYYMRMYDNKYWESVYRNSGGTEMILSPSILKNTDVTKGYKGGTIVDLGVVAQEHRSEYHQWIVPSRMDYKRYLCINELTQYGYHPNGTGEYKDKGALFRTKGNLPVKVMVSEKAFLVINATAKFEKYIGRNYINPDWGGGQVRKPGLAAGLSHQERGRLKLVVKVGNKYWNGGSWGSSSEPFDIELEKTSGSYQSWNEDNKVLNTVSWRYNVNEEGYKIPLEGVDISQGISIEIHKPNNQWVWNRGNPSFEDVDPFYNAYCWLSDMSIKIVESDQDFPKEDSDIVYENIIDADAVNEMKDITVRLTTWCNLTKPSYSNVIYEKNGANTLLETITEPAISNAAQKPEENIVEKYVKQFDTTTKSFSITLDKDIPPYRMLTWKNKTTEEKDNYVDNGNERYVILGQNIDYAMGRQTLKLMQKK